MSDTETMEVPELDAYLDEPEYDEDSVQDEPQNLTLGLIRAFVPPTAPRTFGEALDWCAAESAKPSENYAGRCQYFIRRADDCPGGFSSAKAQWFGMDSQYRFVDGSIEDAPVGADLFSVSHNPASMAFKFGHIIKKARRFKDGSLGAWSTDALRVGAPDKINPLDLYARWNHEYLGWGYQINGRVIDLKDPKPVQDKQYVALSTAVINLQQTKDNYVAARKTARNQNDKRDVAFFDEQIINLNTLIRKTKVALEQRRHS
jgi:hypothetical protein